MSKKDWEDLEGILDQRFKPDAKRPERLQTGISSLDQILNGGLSPGLIILGGTPGVGKSTLALQIAAHVAGSGHPVLYFSLEMQAVQILAKLICQKICKDTFQTQASASLCITADSLLNGMLDEPQWDQVAAAKQALSLPLKNLHICTTPLSASGIANQVNTFVVTNERKPLVIIDYLQLVRPENSVLGDKQVIDSNLDCFMRLAHIPTKDPGSDKSDLDEPEEFDEHGNPIVYPPDFYNDIYFAPDPEDQKLIDEILDSANKKMASLEFWEENIDGLPVILISSLNRNSYGGPMTISAFKETGGIEYSADLLLGLQFRACRKKSFDQDKERAKSPREVELTILKSRYGSSGDAVPLQYESAHDYFYAPEETPGNDTISEGKEAAEKLDQTAPENSVDTPPDAPDTITASNEAPAETHPKALFCVVNNTRVANEIRKGKTGERCRVLKNVDVSYALSEPLSSFDCCVADAIYTLAQDQKKLSLRAILQVLMGYKQANLTTQMKEELNESIQHLQHVALQLDCTQHLRAKGILDDYVDWSYAGPFLAIEGPDEKGVYRPAQKEADKGILPLYTYGAKINQMITIPSVLLDVVKPDGRRMSNTEDNICLKRFLAHRLEIIRYQSLKSKKIRDHFRIISFRTGGNLFEEFRFTESLDPYRLKHLHDSTELILNYYKTIGYITQFKQDETDRLSSFKISGTIKSPWT